MNDQNRAFNDCIGRKNMDKMKHEEKENILAKVESWFENNNNIYSRNAGGNCKHYLYTASNPNPQDYGKWMRDIWSEAPWKNSLESLYRVKLCGIHYTATSFEELVVLAPISTPEIEKTLQAYSETFLHLSPYKSHFAYIMKENKIDKSCHFRLGRREDKTGEKNEEIICYIPDKLLDFFMNNFKVCHLSVTLKNIQNDYNSVASELKKLKKDLSTMGLLKKNGGNYYLESMIISFYATLTVLKESTREVLFNDNESVDAIFVPIKLGGNEAVVPSLHSKLITLEEIESLKKIYDKIFTKFILWEISVSRMDEVKRKFIHKFPNLSKALKNLKEALSKKDWNTAQGLITEAKKILEKHMDKNKGGI